ncbi:glycosyltransferase family 2 protein [Nocardia sp. NPDC055165]
MRRSSVVPTVSIIVLNFNYGHYLGEALASALAQRPGGYHLSEVVVIDDGSTDHSHTVYADFPEVRVVRKQHEGFPATLTRAVGESSSEWFAPLDADDAFVPHKLRTLAPYLSDPDLLVIQHAEFVVDSEGRPFGAGTHPGGATSTLLVRTDVARDLLPVTNELFFHVPAELGHGIRLPNPLTRYRVHDASMTDRRNPGVFADYMADIHTDVAERLERLSLTPPSWAGPTELASLGPGHRERAARLRADARDRRQHEAMTSAHKENLR